MVLYETKTEGHSTILLAKPTLFADPPTGLHSWIHSIHGSSNGAWEDIAVTRLE